MDGNCGNIGGMYGMQISGNPSWFLFVCFLRFSAFPSRHAVSLCTRYRTVFICVCECLVTFFFFSCLCFFSLSSRFDASILSVSFVLSFLTVFVGVFPSRLICYLVLIALFLNRPAQVFCQFSSLTFSSWRFLLTLFLNIVFSRACLNFVFNLIS